MSRTSTRGQPGEPQWVYSTSAVDLKLETINRIESYFEYDSNVASTAERDYLEWVNGNVSRASPTRVCKYAIDVLRLHSMKWTIGTKLTKQVMLLSPFETLMEAPEPIATPSNTDSKSSDDSTEHNVEETNPVTMSEGDNSPALVEGNSVMAGDTMMVSNSDEALAKMITDTVDKYFVQFRERMMKDMETLMRKMIENVMQSTMDGRVTEALQRKGKVEIDTLFDTNKPTLIQKVQATIEEVQKRAENDLISKSQTAIKNIAIKRDEVLNAINEETDQAIEDFHSATEQVKKDAKWNLSHDIQLDEPNHTQKSQRFSNVDPYNLKVEHRDINQQKNNSPRQSQPTWSLYGFHKHFKAKLRNDTQILNFYQQLYTQGSPYGVFCVPLQDIHPNIDLCPPQYRKDRNEIALTIYQKLQDEDCVSIGYKKAQRLIQQYAASSDGYRVMEQLLRSVHPNLMHSTASTYEVPKLSLSYGNLYDYGSKVMNYILLQGIRHRKFSNVEQTIMFLNNMDDEKYHESKNRALAEIRHITSSGIDTVDPNLMLESLPTTLEQYHEQIHGPSSPPVQRHIRSLYDSYGDTMCEETDDSEDAIVRTFVRRRDNYNSFSPDNRTNRRQYSNNRSDRNGGYRRNDRSYNNNSSNKQCKACGRWGCSERKCQFVAKVQLAVNFIKTHGNAAAKLAEEYLRTNDRRTRMSTIRTLTANLSVGDRPHATDDELLHQYHVEIPMEEIDFDHDQE